MKRILDRLARWWAPGLFLASCATTPTQPSVRPDAGWNVVNVPADFDAGGGGRWAE